MDPALAIIAVLLLAGLLGGLANHLMNARSDPEHASWKESIVVGIAASFMVPLFLNMISSDLLGRIVGGDAGEQVEGLLLLAGFSIAAAVSSRAFVASLSARVLREVQESRKETRDSAPQ